MANLLDRLVGFLDPNAGLRRLRARDMLARAYEGASQKDGWRPRRSGASANTDHMADASALRTRARSLVQNVPYITRGIESLVSNTVGTGIAPRSLAPNATTIDQLYADWSRVADADGRLDLPGLQAAAYQAMEQDGEVLIRKRMRRAEDGLPVPLQLQLLEIDWLDTSKTGTVGPNTIINGIEYDPLGRVASYWLFDQHPGEVTTSRRGRASSYPVAADSIIHLYRPQRPGQGRGFTRLAPVIARVRDLMLYEDAEQQRKNLETRLSVISSGDVASLSMSESEDANTVRKTGELGSLASGSITQIPAGNNLTVIEPKAAPGYVEYVKYQLHLIAAGMGVTYEMLTGDVSDVNFSSARVNLLEFRRAATQVQWLTLIPKLCEPIWRAFIDAAVLAGKLRQADYAVDWSTPKWDYVNPEQDVKADLAEISGGLTTISEKLRQRGYKPELVFAELKSDFDRLRKDGTLELLLQLQTGQAPDANRANAPAPAARAATGEEQAMATMRETVNRLLDQTRALADRAPTPAPAPPVVNIDLGQQTAAAMDRATDRFMERMQDMPITINVPEQPAPVVQITNEVRAAAEAPVIHFNPTVQPATVQAAFTATLPARKSETVIERDARGNIIKSTSTESDA